MSDKGSDLDVFDGLAAKKTRPSAPAPPPSSHSRAVPPPPVGGKKTLLGLAAPPPPPSKGPMPPPGSKASLPPPPPPPPSRSISAPPPAPSKAARPSGKASLPPPPPPSGAKPPPPPGDDDQTPVPGRATSKAPGGKADIDWDDDDEATQIFDRGHEDASRSLLHSAPPGAPPPLPAAGAPPPSKPLPAPGMPPASRAPTVLTRPGASRGPLPPPPVTAPAAPAPTPPPSIPDAAMVSMMQPQSRSGVWAVLFAVVVIGAAAAGAYLFFMPKKGTIVVTVAGPGNKPVDAVEVWVDATKVCDKSPCRTPELAGGTHLVKVTAAGYQPTADQAVKVVPGDEAVHNVTLQRGSGGTGLKVTAEGRGLRLSVDGKEIGPLPQELRDLSPGEHTVQIQGGDRYESYEETVTVEADKMLPIEPKLKVKKGLATIKLGDNADGAKVLLVTGNERRPLPALPITVDIPTEKPYQIVAEKKGLQPFVQKIAFEDGAAEKTFTIDMAPFGPAITPDPDPAPAPKSGGGRAPAVARTTTKSSTQATGNGTININSIPASNVILDGRPLGSTPKAGISVSPGAHTVIFIHPEHGRKAKTVNVEAGKAVSAAVKFP